MDKFNYGFITEKDYYNMFPQMKTEKCYISKIIDENKQLKEELDKYKRLIEYIKTLELYEYDLDYDYEENPVDNYYSADMNYHIENYLKLEKGDSNDI